MNQNYLFGVCDQVVFQGWHRLEKYLNLKSFLEKSLKLKSVLKSTGKSLKSLGKSLNSTIFLGLKVTLLIETEMSIKVLCIAAPNIGTTIFILIF